MSKTRIREPGRGWAYTGMIVGGFVSVAANVAHSFIPPTGAPAVWEPKPGAIVTACVWPIFLLMIIEVHARVQWPQGKGWWLLRWIGFPPVAGVAAFVSYRHLSGLLAYYGEEAIVSTFGPLAVDGVMITCTAALLAINHRVRAAANLAAALTPVTAPVAVANAVQSVPAVVAPPVPVVAPAVAEPAPAVPVTAEPVPVAALSSVIPSSAVSHAPRESAVATRAVKPPAAAPAPSTASISGTASDAAPPKLPVPAALLTRASHIARAHLTATGVPITAGELAVRMHIDSKMAAQVIAVLDLQPDSPTKPVDALNGSPVKVTGD